MPTLVIVRHGQSQWNLENLFTGEVDVDLTALGEKEAKKAGHLLRHYVFAAAHTSLLKRAVHTLEMITKELDYIEFKVYQSAALNERNYGDLQGLNKTAVEEKYGTAQLNLWRRSYEATPPNGESLADTYTRVIPYYKTEIEPSLKKNQNILIVAHGNSLRALMMYLENIGKKEIATTVIPTGQPKVYELDVTLRLLKTYYLEY